MANIQTKTLGEIRRSIGRNLGVAVMGVATTSTTPATTTLTDTRYLQGGDDEHNMNEVMVYDSVGSAIADGEKSVVSDYTGTTHIATVSPAFTAAPAALDKYEMWKYPWLIADVNDAINQVLMGMTGKCPQIKEDHTLFTESSKYLYTIPSGFVSLSKVEYVSSRKFYHLLDDCEDAWTGGTGTTTTADSSFEKVGTYCSKNVAASVGVTTILCYKAISSVDISDCDKVEFWMYSSIALTAGQLTIQLDDTAALASAVESIDIPAMDAATWYKHSLSLANPHSDTAIISIGIYQVANVADFTFYVDQVEAVMSTGKVYKELPKEYWNIVKGSTNYLQLTSDGLTLIGTDKQLRLTGYQNLTLLTDDDDESEIDPGWLINKVTGELLLNHAKSSYLDIDDRYKVGTTKLSMANAQLSSITTGLAQGTIKI